MHLFFLGLYPTCMISGGEFYCGIPEIIRKDFKDPSEYKGLLYGHFIATKRDLFLPVLPCRENDKLYFTLCAACAKSKSAGPCTHTEDERAITTIVTTEEFQLARRHGYECLELFEV